ncbi:GntR family transcriptional regulator [Paraburkholderia rhynchosiae]|uniref:GntR family transcriptional regulator n=1 Tax=Paraburkholderia rhynchosiae TaxID=487049 RepID=A0A2N7WH94_9BURK|nr:GntR family transcriptional regulator [Paraburkholderia rhynchosiae]PMS28846.1 GntR family transcriptional regulator [Paraburkholderia rhynchosiae]CAB3655369.1 HTH-type transcriptional repressor RspR [Paraburkholderia rhynchosiae]
MHEPISSLKVERRTTTLRALALEKMRSAILDARFQPGARLVERTLCEELGVSRTVVREVLRHLETEGLVDTLPNQGPIVAVLDLKTATEIYEIRGLLEGEAASACARLADTRTVDDLDALIDSIQLAFDDRDYRAVLSFTTAFYERMFTAGHKHVAWEIVQSLTARINRLRALTIASDDRGSQAVLEMRQILAAIRAGDAVAAHSAAVTHISGVAEIARKLLVEGQGLLLLKRAG